ncbi:MAG: phosphomannomutase/phosphoglucomutase [Bdellovibrionota bacterium]
MINAEIFREYDIRGVVDRDFDSDFARDLGRALVTYLSMKGGPKNPVISVGHDARLSSPSLSKAMCDGLQSAGARVVFLGLVTSPISYFSMFNLDNPAGGVMITGSHNPPEYNGFKISVGKTTIYGSEIQELLKIMTKGEFATGQGAFTTFNIFDDYVARYKQEFKDLKPVKVVLDCGNGAAGCIARRLYEAVGLKPIILFEEPDGRFPNHHPDPTVEKNVADLKKAVKEHGAAIGIGFDGDADRIGIVDDEGRFIAGDEMMVVISRGILMDNPGAKIIGDVKCSDRLYEDIRKHGGQPIMWKTGHSLVKTKIKEEKAPFGGELSGHVFYADRNYGYDDALYAGLRLIELLGKTGKTVRQLLEGLPTAFNTPEIRIDTTEAKKRSIVEKLREAYKGGDGYKVNLIDGIRISYPDGWALARASNTQPVLVLRFESNTQKGLDRIQNEIESIVNPLL